MTHITRPALAELLHMMQDKLKEAELLEAFNGTRQYHNAISLSTLQRMKRTLHSMTDIQKEELLYVYYDYDLKKMIYHSENPAVSYEEYWLVKYIIKVPEEMEWNLYKKHRKELIAWQDKLILDNLIDAGKKF